MNKVFASAVITAAVLVSQAFADTIILNDGQIVEKANVSKVGVREIEYTVGKRKVLYAVKKSDVARITYKDGSVDVFPIREKRKDRDGDEFRGPRSGKRPRPGMGPGGERGEFRGGPGGFRGREEIGDYPERDAPIPPDGPRGPRDHGVVNPRNIDPPPPPPPQGHAVTPPPPPQGNAVTPPPPPPPPPAPAQSAKTPPPPTPPQGNAVTPPPPAQPAPAQPAKTLPAPAPAQPAAQPAK